MVVKENELNGNAVQGNDIYKKNKRGIVLSFSLNRGVKSSGGLAWSRPSWTCTCKISLVTHEQDKEV